MSITLKDAADATFTTATDVISTVHYQVVKLGVGADGTAVNLAPATAGLNSTGAGIPAVQLVGQFDDTTPTSVSENQFGNLRMSANRNMFVTIRDAAGNERGLNVDAAGAITVTATNLSTNLAQVAGSATATGNGTAAGSLRVSLASDSTGQAIALGNIAHDTGDSGAPVKIGGRASNAVATATMVASADRTDAIFDIDGVLLTKQAVPLANVIRYHGSVTATTSTAATGFGAVASTKNVITGVIVHNSSATDTYVELQDGNGGTTFAVFPAPQKGGSIAMLPVPIIQPTANTALYFKENSAATSVFVTLIGYQTKAA